VNSEPERKLDEPNESQAEQSTQNDGTVNETHAPATVQPPQTTTVAAPLEVHKTQADAVTLVLQWLTYAFWGWFALAMLWLSAVVYGFVVAGSDSSSDWASIVSYPIASVLVLLIVAAVVDFFYRRREPAKKEGFATAVMVIHTVIFALFGIGALVGAVFTLISLVLNDAPSADKGIRVALYTALTLVPIYAILTARTTLVAKWRKIPMLTTIVLGAGALVFIVVGVFGPVMQSVATRQDRQVTSALSTIVYAVNSYDQDHDKLPESLDGLSYNTYGSTDAETVKSLLAKGVITYKPNTDPGTELKPQDTYSFRTVRYYQLCGTFTNEQKSSYGSLPSDKSSYSESINAQYHAKGEQCYNVKTNTY
jgi:hypothetical protein